MTRLAFARIVPFALAVAACGSDPDVRQSADEPVSNLVRSVGIQSNGSVAVVAVRLRTTDFYGLVLSPSEGLAIDAPGAPTSALEARGEDAFVRVASAGSRFVLRHLRPDGETRIVLDLPPPFTLSGPETLAPGEALTLRWEADETAPVVIEASSPCAAAPVTRNLARDRGEYTFQPSDFGTRGPACPVVVRVTRTAVTAASGDTITARQIRTLTVETTP